MNRETEVQTDETLRPGASTHILHRDLLLDASPGRSKSRVSTSG